MSSQERTIPSISFKFSLKAVSFQGHRFGNGTVYKTQNQQEFLSKVDKILLSGVKTCKAFSSSYDSLNHVMVGQWIFLYQNFFTKREKTISSKVPDLENGKKMVQDRIFKFMGLNDKDIVHSDDIKWEGDDTIIFTLKLMEREEFQKLVEKKLQTILQ